MLICLTGGGTALAADASSVKEYQVKAAFVYNFMKFVEWPAKRFDHTNSPLIIAVAGKSPMFDTLALAIKGRRMNGRELLLKQVATPEAARAAHVLFVAAGQDEQLDGWLREMAGSSVLTVGESETFGKRGGMINFLLESDKVRFEINLDSANGEGLQISAQLLKLATTVRRKK
ncbi:MAG: YfiR family protein [Akkermansiaceae bacterium]|nr:YfiR family protein [Verrucomicrobiales bacterium]